MVVGINGKRKHIRLFGLSVCVAMLPTMAQPSTCTKEKRSSGHSANKGLQDR